MADLSESKLHHLVRGFGPAIGHSPAREVVRAAIGCLLGLALSSALLLSPAIDLHMGLSLIAPIGATAVLVFAAPNSPLAQPWSAVMGNAIAALVGVLACMAIPDMAWRIPVAVGAAVAAMIPLRAVHPPAGAIAMTAAMNPDTIGAMGFRFVLTPVLTGTVALVVLGMIYARLTGRRYPFRQFQQPGPAGGADLPASQRLGLSEQDLTDILERYRQSLNLGPMDLARLIGAAQLQAAAQRSGPVTAADIMSRDLVTVPPQARLSEVVAIFGARGFASVPVVDGAGRFLGLIEQIHLLQRAHGDSQRSGRRFARAMARLIGAAEPGGVRAASIMDSDPPRAAPDTPLAALLPMLASGQCHAVPVLEGAQIVGIVTQTDLIATLARQSLSDAPAPG